MSSSFNRRAGKYGEDEDGSFGASLPMAGKPSSYVRSTNSNASPSSRASSSKSTTSPPSGGGTADVPHVYPTKTDDISTLSGSATSSPSYNHKPRAGAAPSTFADYKVSLQEEEEEEAFEVQNHHDDDEDSKPPAVTRNEDSTSSSVTLSNHSRITRNSGTTTSSLYPDLGTMEQQDLPSQQYQQFVKETSDKTKDKPPPPSDPNVPMIPKEESSTFLDPSLRKQWPPVPRNTPSEQQSSSPTFAELPLTEQERAAKERAAANSTTSHLPPALTPGATMVPGIRSTEPWIPNNEEEDPDLKSMEESYSHFDVDQENGEAINDSDSSHSDGEQHGDDGIIKATMVVDHVPEAQAVSEKHIVRRRRIIMAVAALLVVGIVVGLSVGLTSTSSSSTVFVETTPSPTAITPSPTSAPTETPRPTLETVVESGVLKCGVTDKKGFSIENTITRTREGFDIDLCRAVAAAVLGNPNAIETTVLSGSERFTALRDRTVDMLARVTTHTMERDVYEKKALQGFSFAAPYLYDGLGFGGVPDFVDCADSLTTFGACVALKVCVLEGTTHMDVLGQRLPDSALISSVDRPDLYKNLVDGDCNVIAGEQFDVAQQVVRDAGLTGPYKVGTNLFSKEPLALVVREGDEEWYDFVSWVFQALLIAEEEGIFQSTFNQFPATQLFGSRFSNMFRNAIDAVGNYGEIYQRHLEPIVPREGLNTINSLGATGLIYSFPFGTLGLEGPAPSGTIDSIQQRGQLRCGIISRPGAGQLVGTNTWSGIDADYCRAVAAALFATSSPDDVVEFLQVQSNDMGLLALSSGDVDVFVGGAITFDRDVQDQGSGLGYTFTTPYFYYPTNLILDPAYEESLSLVTLQDDPRWADFCSWIVHATFFAAEANIGQSAAMNSLPQVSLLGPGLEDMFRNAVAAVGNYNDIYTRSLAGLFPIGNTTNQLNNNPVGPQQYPLPGLI